jgi:UDP-N-acetyl-2-amino-2-deoxyglucuronate dehydrogenase
MMENQLIKVALVGCGRIARRHADLLSGQVEGARLAAVCDVDFERAMDFGETYEVPWFQSMDRMLSETELDLVAVLTPSGQHATHALRLMAYGVPLLIEKPLCLRLRDVDRVIASSERYGVPVGEVKQNRYNLAVQHLRAAMNEGRLDKLRLASVRVWWSRDAGYYQDWHGTWHDAGGVLANQAIHHVDLLQWLLGDVARVSAVATHSPYTQVETGLCATLEFESGCIGTIEATTLARPCDLEGSLAILGDGGTVELGGFAVNAIRNWKFAEERPDDDYVRKANENPPDVYGFGHLKLYEDVVRCLRDGREMPVNVREARKALEIIHAVYESVETGQAVELNGGEYPHSRLGE